MMNGDPEDHLDITCAYGFVTHYDPVTMRGQLMSEGQTYGWHISSYSYCTQNEVFEGQEVRLVFNQGKLIEFLEI